MSRAGAGTAPGKARSVHRARPRAHLGAAAPGGPGVLARERSAYRSGRSAHQPHRLVHREHRLSRRAHPGRLLVRRALGVGGPAGEGIPVRRIPVWPALRERIGGGPEHPGTRRQRPSHGADRQAARLSVPWERHARRPGRGDHAGRARHQPPDRTHRPSRADPPRRRRRTGRCRRCRECRRVRLPRRGGQGERARHRRCQTGGMRAHHRTGRSPSGRRTGCGAGTARWTPRCLGQASRRLSCRRRPNAGSHAAAPTGPYGHSPRLPPRARRAADRCIRPRDCRARGSEASPPRRAAGTGPGGVTTTRLAPDRARTSCLTG